MTESQKVGAREVVRTRLHKRGLPVFNRPGLLETLEGRLVGWSGRSTLPPLRDAGAAATITRAEAIALAGGALPPEAGGGGGLRAAPQAELGWFAAAEATLPAWRVTLPLRDPVGSWQVVLDAERGTPISAVDLVRSVVGAGDVYDPNLIATPVPVDRPLHDLDGSGLLAGSYVRVLDSRAPSAFAADQVFRFPPGDPRFVQTNAYRALTETGRFAVARGFPAFTRSFPAYTNIAAPGGAGEYNNAFYDPVLRLFGFGNGDLTANLGTDFDVAAHEMGHHFVQELVDPVFFFEEDPIVAISEGVADTVSALVSQDPDIGESTIPGQPFLRTLLNSKILPDDIDPDPHLTGLIYGGANWEIVQLIGVDAFTPLLFAALATLPSDAEEVDYRDAILAANLSIRGGAQQAAIQAIFTARGFDDIAFPPEFLGILEDGISQAGLIPDDGYVFYGVREFPGATAIQFQTTGVGDLVLSVIDLDDVNSFINVDNARANESVTLTPFTNPSLGSTGWLVVLFDYPDGSATSYQVSATTTLPAPQIVAGGPAVPGHLAEPGEIDMLLFQTTQPNEVVRVEVEALSPGFDPVAIVVDTDFTEAFGADDDSGPGTDALIQGALLPTPDSYAVAIVALSADVDPAAAIGSYEVRLLSCDNSQGTNTDGDALVDACDDDDDDDGFRDALDSDPLDPGLCADVDRDGCDDCTSGTLDPFADGPDQDADGLCDPGDADDDNDGCFDTVDPAPFVPSGDADLDFLGDDCDNCATTPNPGQEDAGGVGSGSPPDAIGDACQCGDVDGDGFVTGLDGTLVTRAALQLQPFPGGVADLAHSEKCDVGGTAGCSGLDGTLIKRASLGLPPGVLQVCPAAGP